MKSPPRSALLSESQMALFADFYEFTMGQADVNDGNRAICTANYFVRSIPQGHYLILAGMEQIVHYTLNLRFTDADLEWLRKSQMAPNMSDEFVDYLRGFKFRGDIHAIPEGTPVFANEPLINITGPTIDVQMFETYLLSVMNFQTLIATKASRMVRAARGGTCFDFGARRAHGRDAGILAARASFIGGVAGTSLVAAGRYFDIPCVGTVAHKFILDRPVELEAFRAYAKSFPHNTVLLIDTYETIQGAKNACLVGKEMEAQGYRLRGVRLDSGDLLKLSQEVRSILDSAGLTYVQIFASGDLDEFKIDQLRQQKAPIDGFGIGTRLATGANFNPLTGEGGVSALPGVYKHVERNDGSDVIPTMKFSDEPGKSTLPARKQVYRFLDADGCYERDVISLWGESSQEGEALLVPIVHQGRLVYHFPSVTELQARATEELSKLPERHMKLTDGDAYPVTLSPQLTQLRSRLSRESGSVFQN